MITLFAPRIYVARAAQRGIGMVEVMVSMLLGAIVIIGVTQLFTANRQTFRMQDGMAMTQESGTFAVDFMASDALRAGTMELGAPTNQGQNDAAQFDWANTTDGGAGGNDSLAVVYQIDPQLMPTMTTYCTGEDLAGQTWISNRYWVDVDGNLMCQGASFNGATTTPVGAAQVLASNVESFQVLFGVNLNYGSCPTGAGAPTAYVTADRVAAVIAKAKAACPSSADNSQWARTAVRAVRIALMLRTENPAGAVINPATTYTVLDQTYDNSTLTLDDGRLHRMFSRTVLLRNNG